MKNNIKQKFRIFPLIFAIMIPLLVGGSASFLTVEDIKIYESMVHPPLSPPSWIFPIAWTILYVLMGLASYCVYIADTDSKQKMDTLLFYSAQLSMNLFWPTIFFTYARYLFSLFWLFAMWALVLICVIRFYRIRKSAGIMMGVLFLWSTFALYLNFTCYVMSITPMPLAG